MHEKKCRRQPRISCQKFLTVIDDCDLLAMVTVGSNYTWIGRRGQEMVQVRPDKAFSIAARLDTWSNVSCSSLPRHCSDHNQLLLSCKLQASCPSLFRFRVMWTTQAIFMDIVKGEWVKAVVYGSPMQVLMFGLKHFHSVLQI